MPTRQELLAEAYRRGVMPPDKAALYEEGVRRGTIRDDYARGRLQGGKHTTGFDQTLAANVPFMDEFKAGAQAAIDTASGKGSFGRNWRQQRDWQAGARDAYRAEHPIAANAAQGLAYDIQAIPAFFSGGLTAAPNIYTATEPGFGAWAGRTATAAGRNAVVGGSYAGLNAAADRGTLSERVTNAGRAVPVGAAVGVAVPAALGAPSATAKGVRAAIEPLRKPATRAANNVISRAGGNAFLDPREEAFARLGEALRKDGFDAPMIKAALEDWQRVGGPSPAFMDLISQGGRGQHTMALIRGSAMSGEGRNLAAQHGNQVAADLQQEAIARTRQMTGERRPAAEVAAQMRKDRGNLATEQYREPYQTQVPVSPQAREVLTDAPGKAALRQARADALERRDAAQVREIDALLAAEPEPAGVYEWSRPPPETVSGATLDRTQIAMRERADRLAGTGKNARAGGARDRRAVINRDLDAAPHLAEARNVYRQASQQIEGVEKVGPQVMSAVPDEYASDVARLGPGARPAVQVGAARTIEETVGRPPEGATGVLNRIGTSTNTGRNLETTFGEGPAADYRQSINQMRQQVENARFINPNTGSQTGGRLADQSLVESALETAVAMKTGGLSRIVNLLAAVKRGATLTEAERAELVRIATGKVGGGLPGDVERALEPPPTPLDFQPAQGVPNVYAIPVGQDKNRR